MRVAMAALLGVLAAALPAAAPAWAQGSRPGATRTPSPERDAVVANELGVAIRELYAAPAGQTEPGPDRLGADTLPAGGVLRLRLGRNQPCVYNFRAVLADDTTQERREHNLCRAGRVVFGDPTAPLREASVVNDADSPLRELYVYLPGAPARGADRLGSEMVAPGRTLRVPLGRTRDCVFDVTAVYTDDTEETRQRMDLCRSSRVAFGDPSIPWRQGSVENRSGQALTYLYALPAGRAREGAWGPDRLGSETVADSAAFRLRIRSPDCRVDLRAVYEDEGAEEKRDQDLCANTPIVFDGSGVPRPPEIPIVLVNRHAAAIEEVYVSSASERDWGPDRLEAPIERGARLELSIAVSCPADLRVVFGNGAAEERRELDLCNSGTVVLRPGWTVAEALDNSPAGEDGPRPGSVRLRNGARVPIVELYVDAPGEARGPDRLGRNVLGARETLDLAPPEPGACAATLLAVFRDGREVKRDPFDLCQGTEVVLP
ncbi:hypothetical protein [Roseomonas sp. BN140053]|uniref:hypothetical protein n=1 Tax=Roseomonas sp. BN140053 TaxID=3391898 RepID=UPI0039EB826A